MIGASQLTRRLALSGTSALAMMLCAATPARAQADTAQDNGAIAAADASSSRSQGPEAADDTEIVVTGSSIRGVPPTGSNLIRVSRQDIELIGATTVPELLATVPQLNSFNTAPRTSNGGLCSFSACRPARRCR